MPKKNKTLRVGAFQFKSSGIIATNRDAILRGMREAATRDVRLLALPECALSGYIGVDIDSADDIDRAALTNATVEIAAAAKQHALFISLGTTSFIRGKVYNSLRLLGDAGRTKALYHKRGMYEDDRLHYTPGAALGHFRIDGIAAGLRLCYDFRFPEYFRELLVAQRSLAVMGFCMVGKNADKMPIARAHLMSRAAENGLWILAANNCRGVQNCPTCLIDPEGTIIAEADTRKETLVVGTVTITQPEGLRKNIVDHARELQKRNA